VIQILKFVAFNAANFRIITLERIKIRRTHFTGSDILVNPLFMNQLDQIHAIFGSLKAIPTNHDLI